MKQSAASLYATLSAKRNDALVKARECSRLTITGLIPADGASEHSIVQQPYSSVGAQRVSNLSSRLLMSLFPVSIPFFQYRLSPESMRLLAPDEIPEASQRMAELGYAIYDLMDSAVIRQTLTEAIKHLVVGGNVLIYIAPDRQARLYRLDQYVVRRDTFGHPLNIIVRECVYPSELSEEIRLACKIKDPTSVGEQRVDVYTVVERVGDKAVQYQEINGIEVPDSRGEVADLDKGWLALRWRAIAGCDYGEGHAGDYLGDLITLDDLTGSLAGSTAIAARTLFMVAPNSNLSVNEIAEARNGDILYGEASSVSTVQSGKYNDLSVCRQAIQDIERRLADAFLQTSNAIRDAERVTAEEIRKVTEELETTLGGVLTTLSAELQLPLVRRFQYLGAKAGVIPALSKEIKPQISTGLSALGKAASANTLRSFISDLQAALGPQAAAAILKSDVIARELGRAAGVENLEALLKTSDEQAADQQNAMVGQMASSSAPEILRQVGAATQAHN